MSERREEQKGPVDETAHRGQPLRAGRWESLVRVFSVLPGSRVKAFEGPEHLMVGSGESQFINCTASCTDPKKLVLETHLNKTLLDSQAQWKLFKVANISKDEKLLCSFTCGDRQETKVFNITVFCECCPRALLPEAGAWVCKPTHSGSVTAPGHCPMVPTSPGSWIQATGSKSAHSLPWPPRTLPATGILSLLRGRQSKQGLNKSKHRFPESLPSWGAPQ